MKNKKQKKVNIKGRKIRVTINTRRMEKLQTLNKT